MKLTAQVIPFSSVVGTGLMLLNEQGQCIGQLALHNVNAGRAVHEEIVQAVADAINRGEPTEADDTIICEGCGKVIAPGDKYTTTLDGCYLCEEDAPSFQDCADHWADRDSATLDDEERETADGCRKALADHVAAGGSPDDKPLTVME